MGTVSELLNNEIYPALYHVLPEALPEFEFTQKADRYRSGNALKVSGEMGESKGKVEVLERAPYWLRDYRGGGCSIWDFVQERDGLETPGEVIRRLAQLAQIVLPEQQLSPEETARIQQANFEAKLWEVVNGYFIDCLSNKDNPHAKTMRAAQVREYLIKPISEGGRGYATELFMLPGQTKEMDRESAKMELGFIPGTADVRKHLLSVGFTETDIFSLMAGLESSPEGRIGTQNTLTFPYRDHTGRIRGMVFRALNGNDYKYLYSAKLERSKILFNLRAAAKDTDLTIVESPLDALHAAAIGIRSITALGGSGDTLNKTQIDLALKYGAKRITLLLDNDSEDGLDRAGAKGTDKAVAFLQSTYPNLRVFVGEYPEGVKDLDELLIKQGVAGYQWVKDNAIESWRYQLDRLFVKYARMQTGSDYLTPKQVVSLQEEVIESAASLPAIDKDQYIQCFVSNPAIQELGISSQSLTDTVNALRAANDKAARNKATRDLLAEAKTQLDKGDELTAIDLLQQKSRAIKESDKAGQFEALLQPVTEKGLAERLQQRQGDIRTGYVIDGVELELPSGAISIIAAPTSHGKTTFLINTALRVTHYHPDKTVYLLSYEEDGDSVLISAMNTYIGTEVSANSRKSIRTYYQNNRSEEFIKRDSRAAFDQKRTQFFSELIEPRRLIIQYVDYSLESLVDAIYYLHKYGNAGVVLIDYIQLISKEGGKFPNRQVELKSICLDLKDVAVETGLPLVLGAQFSREVVNAARMHPTKIGEAGDIERAANLILGFWNNNMKALAKEEETDALTRMDSRRDALYVELLKYRGGKPGLAGMLSFDGNTGVINNYEDVPTTPVFSSTKHSSII